MRFYIADAFAEAPFGGNPAGVALVEDFPAEDYMRRLDAELGFSETAFVRRLGPERFQLRYFTPTEEVSLCGHATIAAFSVLRDGEGLAPGEYRMVTRAGELGVSVAADCVYMDMAKPELLRAFSPEEAEPLYAACGLSPADGAGLGLAPALVSTGLADILLPLRSAEALNRAAPDMAAVAALSQRYGAVGFHLFCLGSDCLARCRNLAPLCGIPEESATGTANGALTFYLAAHGFVTPGRENRIVQGEAMGRPSVVRTKLLQDGLVRVGGGAAMLLRGELAPPGGRL